MARGAEVAGDIVAAGSAVAGLVLVYIGSLSAGFSAFQPQERRAVTPSYQRRAWFAFVGFALILVAVTLALIGKWLDIDCMAVSALWLLVVGLAWVLVTGVLTVMEIK